MVRLQTHLFVAVLLLAGSTVLSQNVFYSQYRRAGQALNPALTGLTPGSWETGALWQQRGYGTDTTQNTYLLQGSYRFDFRGLSDKGYGLKVAYEDKYSIAVGAMGEMRRATLPYEQFTSAYGSFAVQMKTGYKDLIAVGIQVGAFMQPAFYPVTSASPVLTGDTIHFPGSPSATKLDINAGILLGFGKMECWNDDQLYRLQIGLAGSHLLEPWLRDSLPRVAGREIRLHGSYLWEVNRALGIIPFGLVQYADSVMVQAGATAIYRKHYSYIDRIRGGLYYLSGGYLSPSAGLRFYWGERATYGLDVEISYDIALRDQSLTGWHHRGFEISLKFGLINRCWSGDPCSGAYQYETY